MRLSPGGGGRGSSAIVTWAGKDRGVPERETGDSSWWCHSNGGLRPQRPRRAGTAREGKKGRQKAVAMPLTTPQRRRAGIGVGDPLATKRSFMLSACGWLLVRNTGAAASVPPDIAIPARDLCSARTKLSTCLNCAVNSFRGAHFQHTKLLEMPHCQCDLRFPGLAATWVSFAVVGAASLSRDALRTTTPPPPPQAPCPHSLHCQSLCPSSPRVGRRPPSGRRRCACVLGVSAAWW